MRFRATPPVWVLPPGPQRTAWAASRDFCGQCTYPRKAWCLRLFVSGKRVASPQPGGERGRCPSGYTMCKLGAMRVLPCVGMAGRGPKMGGLTPQPAVRTRFTLGVGPALPECCKRPRNGLEGTVEFSSVSHTDADELREEHPMNKSDKAKSILRNRTGVGLTAQLLQSKGSGTAVSVTSSGKQVRMIARPRTTDQHKRPTG